MTGQLTERSALLEPETLLWVADSLPPGGLPGVCFGCFGFFFNAGFCTKVWFDNCAVAWLQVVRTIMLQAFACVRRLGLSLETKCLKVI